ncbi:hypothetical protein POM88_047342 [Heracleum sosnowskyi]|uniref:Nodulin homeobox N-terminal domain-containing protein n=1 Tax=Heracleum sosnowskyi TaxID=360622 RepID=A0AAD8GU44_9APIA|nr:hypothetical protein POM88_047342 [Heracleum sosnowskyi]
MPKGLLQLNAMCIIEILSDDTNFRSYITMHMTDILSTLFLLLSEEFESIWCTHDLLLWEEDANLDYDPFVAAGWVLNSLSNVPVTGSFSENIIAGVKIIVNLHCFAPDIYMKMRRICSSTAYLAACKRKYLSSLLNRAKSLRNSYYLSEQDEQILRLCAMEEDQRRGDCFEGGTN